MQYPSAPAPPAGGGFTVQDTVGSFEGLNYRIDHRDSNSILHLTLHPGYEVKGKPGAMVTMQPTVQIRGNLKFSFKKMVTGGEMAESWFTGPGEVVLAPQIWGDIVPVRVSLAWLTRSVESPLTGIFRTSGRSQCRLESRQGRLPRLHERCNQIVQVSGTGKSFVYALFSSAAR